MSRRGLQEAQENHVIKILAGMVIMKILTEITNFYFLKIKYTTQLDAVHRLGVFKIKLENVTNLRYTRILAVPGLRP